MSKASDKPTREDNNNDSLVMALESLKGLLGTGKKRHAQTDEDLDLTKAEAKDKVRTEVPVLENIIIPGKPVAEETACEPDEQAAEINLVAEEEIDADALLAFQLQLEQELHERLSDYAGQLEHELKEKIAAFVQQQLKK